MDRAKILAMEISPKLRPILVEYLKIASQCPESKPHATVNGQVDDKIEIQWAISKDQIYFKCSCGRYVVPVRFVTDPDYFQSWKNWAADPEAGAWEMK